MNLLHPCSKRFPRALPTLYATVTMLTWTSLALMELHLGGGTESRHKEMVWIPGGPKGRITNLKDCNVKTGKWKLGHKSKDIVKKGTQSRNGCAETLGGTGTAGSEGQHLARVASRVSPRWVVTEADTTMKVSCQTTRPLLALWLTFRTRQEATAGSEENNIIRQILKDSPRLLGGESSAGGWQHAQSG